MPRHIAVAHELVDGLRNARPIATRAAKHEQAFRKGRPPLGPVEVAGERRHCPALESEAEPRIAARRQEEQCASPRAVELRLLKGHPAAGEVRENGPSVRELACRQRALEYVERALEVGRSHRPIVGRRAGTNELLCQGGPRPAGPNSAHRAVEAICRCAENRPTCSLPAIRKRQTRGIRVRRSHVSEASAVSQPSQRGRRAGGSADLADCSGSVRPAPAENVWFGFPPFGVGTQLHSQGRRGERR